jgi:hypothetical protein
MTSPMKQSDQDLLFAVELLIIQQVAKWARVSSNPYMAGLSQVRFRL